MVLPLIKTTAVLLHGMKLVKNTIFSSELFAILKAIAKTMVNSNEHFIIFSDSLSSIQAITNMYSKNPLVQRIHELLANTKNSYLLCWIPSHIGIRGNETVETMAKASLLEAPWRKKISAILARNYFQLNFSWQNSRNFFEL
jgi:hypothetical protein